VLLKISRDGKRVMRFLPDNVPDTAGMIDYTPAPSGDLYCVFKCRNLAPPCAVLARFNREGQILQSSRIEAGLLPSRIAAFSGGNLPMVARDYRAGNDPATVLGIFSDTGKWISSVSLDAAKRIQGVSDSDVSEHEPLPREIDVLTADDGDVYITRNMPSPAVFRISSSGDAIRYDLHRDANVTVRDTLAADGKMIVGYSLTETKENTISYKAPVWELVDLASGRTLKAFLPTAPSSWVISFDKQSLLYFAQVWDRNRRYSNQGVPTMRRYQFVEVKIK
jgi:hypothetical protein